MKESGARWSFGAEFSKGTDVFQHRPASSARCLSSGQKKEDFLGTNDFIFILGFSFGGYCSFWFRKG